MSWQTVPIGGFCGVGSQALLLQTLTVHAKRHKMCLEKGPRNLRKEVHKGPTEPGEVIPETGIDARADGVNGG